MLRATVELYGFAAHCAFMGLTTRDLWGMCNLGSLWCYWPHQTGSVLMMWDIPQICYMNWYQLVRKAYNWRRKEMNATLVYRSFNQLRSKKCEYLSQFSFVLCIMFFHSLKFLRCELKWLAGTGLIPKLSTHIGLYLYREYGFLTRTVRLQTANRGRHWTWSSGKLVPSVFLLFTRQFSSVEYSRYFLSPVTRPGWYVLTLLSSLRLIWLGDMYRDIQGTEVNFCPQTHFVTRVR
jgi:hypothetical protein